MINQRTLDCYTRDNFCKIFSVQHFDAQNITKDIHRHNFFQIILLHKGKVRHWIDFESQEAQAPYISVIFPNQVHSLQVSDDTELDIIMFDDTVFCSAILSNELKDYNIDLQNRLNHIINPPTVEWNEILKIFQSIQLLLDNMNMVKKMQVKFMIKIILLKIIDIAPQRKNIGNIDADIQVYQQFREQVDLLYASERKVHKYASNLGISTKKLTNICFKYTGHSPLEIIHEKLAMELKKSFVGEGLLLKEIAFRYGFSSQSALNKFIERHFGCSPLHLKKELEKNMNGKI